MKSGIYKIVNIITGIFYIGSAVDLIKRWQDHQSDLYLNKHRNSYLQNAWNKYDPDAFQCIILETCPKDWLLVREQYYIDNLNACDRSIGYNIAITAGSNLGVKWNEETRKRMSIAKRKMTIETKLKMAASQTGKKQSAETIEKRVSKFRGRAKTQDEIERIRQSNLGQKRSLETRMKKRKFDKWPCPDGCKCFCNNCMEKKRIKDRLRRQPAFIMVPNGLSCRQA
jgi:group I intron endonuclease